MIVNPQLFNYRLIIGTLVIAVVVLGSISFISYNNTENRALVANQESELVQQELSEMMSLYDDVQMNNSDMASELQQVKSKMSIILDSFELAKSKLPLITKYKQEAVEVKKHYLKLEKEAKDLAQENQLLNEQSQASKEIINQQKLQLNQLAEDNNRLTAMVEHITGLKANNIEATAIKTTRTNNDVITDKAADANNLEVCFTIEENELAQRGHKDIYIQILDSENNVVSDRGAITFGEASLIYSGKTSVNYNNRNIDVCTKINVSNKEPLKNGDYLISVFHDNNILGTSKITLN